ncbi:GNAT family N-acetyltransferase [Paraglaciecola sp. L1A13]|uniref:GNAT family N-acetyltransferase n=1 Tax=Paraglaciecola sp. L1A13 TaxID=2686359 RepID=UPI00131B5308|nr:GNAT family N-acetyltransferase [Paraglaciecola sp. L1A13]
MRQIFNFKFLSAIEQIDRESWHALAYHCDPFHQYAFIQALERSHSVEPQTGWHPQHLTIYQNDTLVGILPLYIKNHSYGEYVFDFAWANSYSEHGLNYYPKLVCAIPFTPVPGARLMLKEDVDQAQLIPQLCKAIQQHAKQNGLSSMHWLFVPESLSTALNQQQHLMRRAVQFQWFNRDYQDYDDFCATLTSRRRKTIRNERRKVHEQGVKVERIYGEKITAEHIDFFYQCYQQTYLKRSGHKGYLNRDFFTRLYHSMDSNILLVIASRDDIPLASAFYMFDDQQLYGRYWGALEDISNLHYECCYYQGIEFCIEHNISTFNPGTQGEHKILRGFEPVYCYSNHWLAEPAFHDGVRRFLRQEDINIQSYKTNASELLPFKVTLQE